VKIMIHDSLLFCFITVYRPASDMHAVVGSHDRNVPGYLKSNLNSDMHAKRRFLEKTESGRA